MSLKERIAEAKAAAGGGQAPAPQAPQGLAARIAAAKQKATQPEAPETPEATWQDRVNAALQGATFGFADEIGTGIAAAAAKVAGSEEDFAEIYSQMMASEQAKRDTYAENNPGENLALNLVGGIATGGVGGAKMLPAGLKGYKALLAKTGVAAGEGAVAGFGSAREGERLEGAKTGAMWGGAFGGTLATAGAGGKRLLNTASKRRVEMPLGKGANRIPLNVAAADTPLGDMAKNTVGRAYGGGRIADQTNKMIKAVDDEMDDDVKKLNVAAFEAASPRSMAGRAADDTVLTDPGKAFKERADLWTQEGFTDVKARDFVIDDDELIGDIMRAVDDPALRDKSSDILTRIRHKVSKNIKRDMIPPDKAQAFRAGKFGMLEDVPPTPSTTGTISGDDLIEARNSFRRKVNKLADGGDSGLQKDAYTKAAAAIDDRIRKQLEQQDPEMLAKFDDELARYANFTTLEKSRKKAASTPGTLMQAKQLLTSSTSGGRRRAAKGEGPLQKMASAAVEKEAGLKQTRAKLKDALPQKVGGMQKALQTMMMGAPVATVASLGLPLVTAGSLALPAGFGAARALSGSTVPRMLAGQTSPQIKVAEALRRYEGSAAQNMTSRLSTGGRRGIVTERTD